MPVLRRPAPVCRTVATGNRRGMTSRPLLTAAAAVAVVLLASGCGGARDDAVRSARSFYAALDAGDGAAACRLLADPTRRELEASAGEPCARAILQQHVGEASGRPHARTYASMALVRWAQETTFLARFGDGWRVFAAGCAPDATSPRDADRYDCDVQGG